VNKKGKAHRVLCCWHYTSMVSAVGRSLIHTGRSFVMRGYLSCIDSCI